MLREVHVRSVVYCLSDFTAPWGFSVEHSPVAKFHVILEGQAALTVGDATPLQLAAGDLVLLPHGDGHTITDQAGSAARQLDAILADHPVDMGLTALGGGPGPRWWWLRTRSRVADRARRVAAARADAGFQSGLARWLEPLFALLEQETQARAPGAAAIFAKLADVFVSAALRSYLAAADGLEASHVTSRRRPRA